MSDWRGWQLLAIFLLSVELVQGDRCPTKGCLATFEPVVASDGQVFLNSCVAACYAASIVRGGNPEATAGSRTATARRASPAVLLRYVAEGYVFVGFAQVQKLPPLQQATAAAAGVAPNARRTVSASIMQQLVTPHSVLRYDVATGAVYNAKATGTQIDLSQLPGGVSYAAQQPPQPPQQQEGLSPSPAPGIGNGGSSGNSTDDEPLILNPEIVIDLPLKHNHSSPSPCPNPTGQDSNSSSPSPSPAVADEGITNTSSSSSPDPATAADGGDGGDVPAYLIPSPSPSTAPVEASSSPSPSAAVSADGTTLPTSAAADHGAGGNAGGRKLQFVRKGNDERTDIDSTPSFPLSAVGQLLSKGQEWHCSGALIAKRTIITAAHCVYDPLTGTWAKSLSFVPSRFRDAAGSIKAPVGAAAISEVFIVGGFAVSEPQYLWEKDMAVVKLAPGTDMGSQLGHLGIFLPAAIAQQQREQRSKSAAGGRKLKLQGASAAAAAAGEPKSSWQGLLSTAGYPADRQQGTLITTKCISQIQAGTTPRAATLKLQRCSTALGQSGGPLIDAAGNVGGVVSYEVLGPRGYNGGCAMTPWLWANLVMPNLV